MTFQKIAVQLKRMAIGRDGALVVAERARDVAELLLNVGALRKSRYGT